MMHRLKMMFRRQRMLPDDGVLLRPFPAGFDLNQPSRRERLEIERRVEEIEEYELADWKPRSLEP